MVLAERPAGPTSPRSGGARPRVPRAGHERASRCANEGGSQSLELALVLPAVVVALLLVLQAGVLGADVVAAQGLARDAARTAAVDGPETVVDAVAAAAGEREFEVVLDPREPEDGEPVTARVRLRSRAFGNVGVDVWIPGRATMRAEGR